jgi:hypothetical protein
MTGVAIPRYGWCGRRVIEVSSEERDGTWDCDWSGMACTAIFSICRNVNRGGADNTHELPGVTGGAAAGYTRMIHPPTQECGCIDMAGFTGLHSWIVRRRFAHDPQRLAIVAARTIADHADMVIIFYQKGGRTGMTSIAFTTWWQWHMIHWSWQRRYACTGGMTSRTNLGRVLENAIDVALFAL